MTITDMTSKRGKAADDRDANRPVEPKAREPVKRQTPIIPGLITLARASLARLLDWARRHGKTLPILITLTTVAVAALLGWAMWGAYMGSPWTRDATVRAYVVTMASEVAGDIVEMHVVDNKYVHKGDLLMVIDPTNYKIALSQAEASVQQAQASVKNIDAQMTVQEAQISASQAQLDQAQAVLVFAQQQADRYQDLAQKGFGSIQNSQQYSSQLHQQEAAVHTAQVNLERTRVLSPVDGYVTNLLAQLGDYVSIGVNTISLVDANSFWVDGYFEETNLAPIRVNDPAHVKLMGHTEIVRGHVDSIARAINVANAQPNSQGVANVNPIFTWVRLAQRIPVRIHIDEVPPGIVLSAGMTATVEIDDRARAAAR
jgi:multidrug resistance efflux pump